MPIPTNFDTATALRQRLAYDLVPDEMLESNAEELGLVPTSEEVRSAEHAASELRRQRIEDVTLVIHALSSLTSDLMRRSMLVEQEDEEDAPSHEQIFAASRAIVASLVDMGIVHLPHPAIGVMQ